MSQSNNQDEPALNHTDSYAHPVRDNATRRNVKKSLKLSVADGGAYAAMLGLTQNYITPYALTMNASTMQVGLLTSIPNFVTAFSQLAAPGLAQRAGSRKGLILPIVFVHALTWVPVFLLPYLFPATGVWWLIAFVTICTTAGALAGGYVAPHLPAIRGSELRTLFSISGVLRGIIAIVLLRTIFEVRRVPRMDALRLLLGRTATEKTRREKE